MLTNPYANTPHANLIRIQAVIDRDDYNLIKSVLPQHGTTFAITGTCFRNIANAIRDAGLVGWSPRNSELATQIVLRCTGSSVTGTGAERPDRSATIRASESHPVLTNDDTSSHGGHNVGGKATKKTTRSKQANS